MGHNTINRRFFVTGATALSALGLAGCNSGFQTFSSVPSLAPTENEKFRIKKVHPSSVKPQFQRRRVNYQTDEKPGTIVVNTETRQLFLVEEGGTAIRYGIGVGRQGFEWKGTATIRRKKAWPRWTPPAEMIARDPRLKKYRGGWEGGPTNPLGARALYLYQGGRDTLYRLHGTNAPRSIGRAMSSGCVRLLNQDIADLYERVPVGTKVIVL